MQAAIGKTNKADRLCASPTYLPSLPLNLCVFLSLFLSFCSLVAQQMLRHDFAINGE